MNYKEELIEKLKNTEGYLWWPDIKKLNDIFYNAEGFFEQKKLEGKISALFLYHQIMIEQIKLLIKYIDFYVQIAIYPTEVKVKDINKEDYFNTIIDRMDYSIEFISKKNIIEIARDINKLRNKYGHKLVKTGIHEDDKELAKLKDNYEKFFDSHGNGLNEIKKLINEAKNRKEIKNLLNE